MAPWAHFHLHHKSIVLMTTSRVNISQTNGIGFSKDEEWDSRSSSLPFPFALDRDVADFSTSITPAFSAISTLVRFDSTPELN